MPPAGSNERGSDQSIGPAAEGPRSLGSHRSQSRPQIRSYADPDLPRRAGAFLPGGFLYGSTALVEACFPVLLLAPGGVTRPSTREMLDRLRQFKPGNLVFTDRGNREARDRPCRSISVPMRLGPAALSRRISTRPSPTSSPARFRPPAWPRRAGWTRTAAHPEQGDAAPAGGVSSGLSARRGPRAALRLRTASPYPGLNSRSAHVVFSISVG